MDHSLRLFCILDVFHHRNDVVTIFLLTQSWVNQNEVNYLTVLEWKQKFVQLQLVMFSVFNFLFIDCKFSELASPEQKLNCQKCILLSPSIIPKNSNMNFSFLNSKDSTYPYRFPEARSLPTSSSSIAAQLICLETNYSIALSDLFSWCLVKALLVTFSSE